MRSPGCQRDEQDIGRQCGEWGFTLPELLATIAIIIITAAIAIPSFFGLLEARRVESAANQLTSDIRLAHSRATNQVGTPWTISLVPNRTSETNASGAPQPDYYLVNTSTGSMESRTLPGNTMIESTHLVSDPTSILSGLGLPATRSSMYFCSAGNVRWSAGSSLLISSPCSSAYTLSSKEIKVSSGGRQRTITIFSSTSSAEVSS